MRLASVLLLAAFSICAQEPTPPTINFRACSIAKGAPKSEVIANLSQSFRVTKINAGSDTWLVMEKPPADNLIGIVTFKGDRVESVSRRWAEGDREVVAFASQMFALLENLTQDGARAFVVTRSRRDADVTSRTLDIMIGGRAFSMYITEDSSRGQRRAEVSVDEVFSPVSALLVK